MEKGKGRDCTYAASLLSPPLSFFAFTAVVDLALPPGALELDVLVTERGDLGLALVFGAIPVVYAK